VARPKPRLVRDPLGQAPLSESHYGSTDPARGSSWSKVTVENSGVLDVDIINDRDDTAPSEETKENMPSARRSRALLDRLLQPEQYLASLKELRYDI
jgi:hypothetical protein